jgi:hypothetical protein
MGLGNFASRKGPIFTIGVNPGYLLREWNYSQDQQGHDSEDAGAEVFREAMGP